MKQQGRTNHLHGLTSEDAALRLYEGQGGTCLARRARTEAGEIDLIVRLAHQIVFVEVKAARTLDAAKQSLGATQIARLGEAAQIWLTENGFSALQEIRFDLAVSDRDGNAELIENALSFDQ